MIANWVKILLFAAGGSTAAAGTAYYTGLFDPWNAPEAPQQVSSAPPPAAPQPQDDAAASAADEAPSTEPAEVEEAPEIAALPQSEEEAPAEVPATAEPVEAGPAVEPATPETVAPQPPSRSGAAGNDFVIPSFDIVRVEPDGSMVIAGTAEPNAEIEVVAGADVIARAEAGADGDFAAVLDDRLEPGDYQIVLRASGPDTDNVATSVETAIVSVPETQDGQVLALVEEPGAPSKLITVPEAETAPEPPAQIAAADEDEPAEGVADRAAAPEDADVASEDAGQDDTAEEEADAPGEAQVAAVDPGEPATTSGETGARLAAPTDLAVEAIEIEGRTVFVAGRAEPGSTVRVYANEILLGVARVSDGGRFLIETQTDLPVGDYIVRADLIAPGGNVIARAAVPFEREPGEAVAAVAPRGEVPAPATPAPAAPASAGETEDGQEPPIADAPEQLASGPESSQAPNADTGVADGDEEPVPTQSGTSTAGDMGADATTPRPAAGDSPSDPGTQPSADPSIAATPPAASDTTSSGDQPEAPADTGNAATSVAVADPIDSQTLAPKLESAEGAVIIRRGDSLWRISRRVYGRGVRYSTIYLANQDQIRDPDMIWPGQIFSVPDETDEGEQADMSRISDQIAPPASAD